MTHIGAPLRIDTSGRTAAVAGEDYIRSLVREVLFTQPGERVNRPDFGSGLLQLVLAPADETLAATTQLTVHSALQRWLGDLIEVGAVEVRAEQETLRVLVAYTVRGSDRRVVEEFGWSL
ncbi:GPW/gp25 family protein [Streptomyces triculaminicus]|uniref:GPW/gp25 family protein n=2 Tax=Streptomyces TaxID=1883 RepID=A0A939FPW7_9ACTN|nr:MULTISPECIES: GPW/gp25 family protein [Streptomyces]MBO0654498.1 GPW/gp25 family protein [Streptomyces triculaminicus]QSY49112.1 GPW/gp25 family protein [Streptomyces griseocarneus]